jgi:hypothetical protein
MLASDDLFTAFARGTAAKGFRRAQSLERFSLWWITHRITVHDMRGRLASACNRYAVNAMTTEAMRTSDSARP